MQFGLLNIGRRWLGTACWPPPILRVRNGRNEETRLQCNGQEPEWQSASMKCSWDRSSFFVAIVSRPNLSMRRLGSWLRVARFRRVARAACTPFPRRSAPRRAPLRALRRPPAPPGTRSPRARARPRDRGCGRDTRATMPGSRDRPPSTARPSRRVRQFRADD